MESSTYHREESYPLDPDYSSYPVVKTHMLPGELDSSLRDAPAIYLVRDGRDCAVSLARYTGQLLEGDRGYLQDLAEVIEASTSHFGGWSEHVRQWHDRAAIIIRFEDLIVDPIGQMERLRPFMDLPEPRTDRLPTFDELKTKDHQYGSGVTHGFPKEQRKHWREGKFRKGRVGTWREEMPHAFQLGFYARHGEVLEKLGYWIANGDTIESRADTLAESQNKNGRKRKKVLIDASKLLGHSDDGIGRYVCELLIAMSELPGIEKEWDIHVGLPPTGAVPLMTIIDNLKQKQLKEYVPPLFLQDFRISIANSSERIQSLQEENRLFSAGVEYLRKLGLKTFRSCIKRFWAMKCLLYGEYSRYDLIHLTLPNNYRFYEGYQSAIVTTVHDLSHLVCPQLQTEANSNSLRMGLEFSRKNSAYYLAVSESTKKDLIKWQLAAPDRVETVLNSVSKQKFKPVINPADIRAVKEKYEIPDGLFLLSVSTIEPRKNLNTLICAFEKFLEKNPNSDACLILAGAAGWESLPDLKKRINGCPEIRYIGFVDDNDLPTLYSAADALCYVSKYEGFGLPILEAMACGTPSIYGNNSSMPEIAGDTGLPADADELSSIALCMEKMLLDEELRRSLSMRAVCRTLGMGWKEAAENTLICYQNALNTFRDSPQKPSTEKGGRHFHEI